ncbi:MAG: CBS domain-containing protein [Anaerolineales bacterium]|nr:CBS domain-containing protein [Anaerolineales bacterium]
MHVILTHEQADFDALAGLYAASRLQLGALAVLPRRVNRNVRAFLTLYGDQLPFIEADDLPRAPIESVLLVDTQALPSLRGMGKATKVQIVDHHPLDPAVDPEWPRSIEGVGATTTLLVESLQDSDSTLELVGATLLLLGIYEDTGSLSYAATTPRDVRAAAWLLESGASLRVADDFLHHPLSTEQRRLYERLLANARTSYLHGLAIVVACAEAEGLVDEISTLAHKLRDLFDPAGLFVIVALNGSVQLVARATTDLLDVGRVAAHFGGGGHSRAAAAIIRGKTAEQVCQEILSLLPDFVQPALTVGEIMSRDPQLLAPEVTVRQAAERMRRFGHEGYPIVEGGKVVGLLTRRAVDRAAAHDMSGRPVREVMEAGELVVHPQDSVQHLQRVMIEHNWGQVPVADSSSGEIVGIVTRTDILRTLAAEPGEPPAAKLLRKLEQALPASRLALLELVAQQAEEQGTALYIVGGFVRDLLLGLEPVDFDLVVEGDAIALARALSSRFGGKVSSHTRFGTAKWAIDSDDARLRRAIFAGVGADADVPAGLDLVAARTEFYTHPTALPSVQRGSIKLDLHRRDFTINTLALRLDGPHRGQLLDPWGGGRDLQSQLIRVLHSISFIDDPTRILRAVRLEQRLGFAIEARTMELLQQALGLIPRVSGERLRAELESVFPEPTAGAALGRMAALGVLQAIDPGLGWDERLDHGLNDARSFDAPRSWQLDDGPSLEALVYGLWLFRQEEKAVQRACSRLHFPAAMAEVALQANRLGRTGAAWSGNERPSQLVENLEQVPEASLIVAWLAMRGTTLAAAIERYLSQWRRLRPDTDGLRLKSLGLRPGPAYRRILNRLRAARLDGEAASPEDEERILQQLLVEEAGHAG